ncbi:RBBP9/YdeN family alpha/beta hydrolase [Neobacillus cucumis]|uniref:RBBP9/YdeN family alpha/beta hydrolase n=1 Tax=Neobacillus cucumis TaxID=1740721 RepID=UPI001964E932|nr:alpha/beta fold hydrolase [Neobacillus cucumis]MBM7655627.1 putative alpha/beta hydrolase family esterase [Neobacillus cucumis]
MNQQHFLIIHGLGGSGQDHWQTWLADTLREKNYQVTYPTFSSYDSPDLKMWLKELDEAIDTIPANTELTVITHSLGCILWLHYAAIKTKKLAKRVILVAPPSPAITLTSAKTFFPVPLSSDHLSRTAEDILFILSNNDPYCNIEDANNYLSLAHPSIVIPNAGHINPASGHGKWQTILDLLLSHKIAIMN